MNTESTPAARGAELREQIARIVWERFAPSHHVDFEHEAHRSEYVRCADAILDALAVQQADGGGRA